MKKILNSIFLLILIVPSLLIGLNLGGDETRENRKLSEIPELKKHENFASFFNSFSDYLADHFPFRTLIIDFDKFLEVNVFKGPYSNSKVAIGSDGFLFYSNHIALNDVQRKNLLNKWQIKQMIGKEQKRRKYCEKYGFTFVRSIYPNKQTIYKESLPFFYKSGIRDTLSRYDQIKAAFKESNLQFLDLRGSFFKEKNNAFIYRHNDTHYNSKGAYIAYRKMMIEVFQFTGDSLDLPLEKDYFLSKNIIDDNGDLVRMLGFHKGNFECRNETQFSSPNNLIYGKGKTFHTVNKKSKSPKKVVLISDSYGLTQRVLFSSHFNEFYHLYNKRFDGDLLLKLKPDIIIQSYVERSAFLKDF